MQVWVSQIGIDEKDSRPLLRIRDREIVSYGALPGASQCTRYQDGPGRGAGSGEANCGPQSTECLGEWRTGRRNQFTTASRYLIGAKRARSGNVAGKHVTLYLRNIVQC